MGTLLISRAISISIAVYISSRKIARFWHNNKQIKDEAQEQKGSCKIIEPPPQQDIDLFDRLTGEVMQIILSKLDHVTFCRCTAASPKFRPLLQRIDSLSFTLPPSLLLPDRLKFLHILVRKFINHVHDKFDAMLGDGMTIPVTLAIRFDQLINVLFKMTVGKPYWSDSRILFLSRFPRLQSVVVQLPPPLLASNSWFRWESEINYKPDIKDYFFLSVHATIVNDEQQEEEQRPIDLKVEKRKQSKLTIRHLKFHLNTMLSLFPAFFHHPKYTYQHHPLLKTLVSKDIGDTGRLTMHSEPLPDNEDGGLEHRCKFSYLSEELVLNASGSNIRIKDAWLWFQCRGYFGGDNNITSNDVIKSLLKKGGRLRDHQLKEVVTKILDHGKASDMYFPLRDTMYCPYLQLYRSEVYPRNREAL